jgi:hypothetical protein
VCVIKRFDYKFVRRTRPNTSVRSHDLEAVISFSIQAVGIAGLTSSASRNFQHTLPPVPRSRAHLLALVNSNHVPYMYDLKRLVPANQAPRFRGEGESAHDGPVPDGESYQTDALCTSCKGVLCKSGILFGSRYRLVASLEIHRLRSSLGGVQQSAIRLHCHFCTIVWYLLSRDQSAATLREAAEDKVLLRVEKRGEAPPFIDVYCDGMSPLRKLRGHVEAKLSYGIIYSISLLSHHALIGVSGISDNDHLMPRLYPSRTAIQTLSRQYMDLARFWVRECQSKHLDYKARNPAFSPSRLVHVGTSDGLVPIHLEIIRAMDRKSRYCTLSHCWGEAKHILKLTAANFKELTEEIPFDMLSTTFKDAIIVTRNLRQQYLWIDSLCIIQDSIDDWTREAATMADIYENSLCTIAAGEVTASQDNFPAQNPLLHNWCRIAGSLNNGIYVKAFCNIGLEGTLQSSLVEHIALLSRGWVFQERLLSPRILFFGSREISWSCRQGVAAKDNPEGPAEKKIFGSLISKPQLGLDSFVPKQPRYIEDFARLQRFTVDVSHNRSPWLHSLGWYRLIEGYSKCNLSKEDDKLIALSGLAQRVQRQTGWKYLAGLWRESLCFDLFWYLRDGTKNRGSSYVAPTWSWASVRGDVFRYPSASDSQPLIKVISAETKTHPLDSTGTGQVFGGELVINGTLRAATDFTFHHPSRANAKYRWQISERPHRRGSGLLYPDVVPFEIENMFFLPLLGRTFQTHPQSPQLKSWAGLALVRKGDFYERVGFFGLSQEKPENFPREWPKLNERQLITIR